MSYPKRNLFNWDKLRHDFVLRAGERTYQDISVQLGISTSTLCRLFNGKTISVEVLTIILNYLNKSFHRYVIPPMSR